jgi:hypothetical protein
MSVLKVTASGLKPLLRILANTEKSKIDKTQLTETVDQEVGSYKAML